MPKGPNGQKRPADAIGCAVAVGRIAVGEEVEVTGGKMGSAGGACEGGITFGHSALQDRGYCRESSLEPGQMS